MTTRNDEPNREDRDKADAADQASAAASNVSAELVGGCEGLPVADLQQMPIALANWVRANASNPRTEVATSDQKSFLNQIAIRTLPNESVSQASSRNWSGAFVRPPELRGVRLVQGRWIVPDTPVYEGEPRGFASSIWVGLDGYDPASRVMPQIGTGHLALRIWTGDLVVPAEAQYCWWQVWTGDNSRQNYIPLTVKRRDMIFAQVWILDKNTAYFYIKNETTNSKWCQFYQLDPHISFEGRTAQWIVERPLSPLGLTDPHLVMRPLSNYGETAFTDCNAVCFAGAWRELQLQRARLVRMNEWDDPERPGGLVSRPDRVGVDALRMSRVGRD